MSKITGFMPKPESMSDIPGTTVSFISPETAAQIAAEPDILALVRFGTPRDTGQDGSPWLDTGLEVLNETPPPVQCWRTKGPVKHARMGRLMVHAAPGLAMIACEVSEHENPADAAETLYCDLVHTAERLGCPHILRIWQYLPRINEPLGDEDRYMAYCAGRRKALNSLERHHDATLPAACLLGDRSSSILLYALVSEHPGSQVENPRQISAFEYPPQYGRASPSFSRALAVSWPDGNRQLYISGTASVVGHATLHDTVGEQTRETLANLEALLEAGRAQGDPGRGTLAGINPIKVYIRRPENYPEVRRILEETLPDQHPVLYLKADVCRADLLVEIEGVVSGNHSG